MNDDFMDIEQALEHLGVPDDINDITGTLPGPDPKATERIKHRAMQWVQSETTGKPAPRPRHSRSRYATAVAVAALLLVVLGIGPNNIVAAMNRLLLYVPGFGIHSTENVNLVAPNPVRAERAGVKIDINGVMADGKGTSVMAYVEGEIPDINSSYLLDPSGQRYPYQGGNMSTAGSGTFQNYWAWYKALPVNVKQVALVIPGLSNWTINIPLAPAADLKATDKFGPSVTVNNVTVFGQATDFTDETKISLLVQSLRGGVLQSIEHPALNGLDGKPYPLTNQPAGFIGSGLSYFSTSPSAGERLTVIIPSLILQQDVDGSAVVPVPDNDSPLTLNQTLNLGPWNLKLTRVQAINQDGNAWLRVYVASDVVDGAIINSLLSKLMVNGKTVDSAGSEFDESTGGIKWFEIPFPTGKKSVKVTVGQINVLVNGPWQIEMPVAHGFD